MTTTIHNIPRLLAAAAAVALLAPGAGAEITQDCILEGTVDMRRARELGQPLYVNFRHARSGGEAGCAMGRRNHSRRVQFISAPDTRKLTDVNVSHGDTVRYRYIERDHQHGSWELIEIEY